MNKKPPIIKAMCFDDQRLSWPYEISPDMQAADRKRR